MNFIVSNKQINNYYSKFLKVRDFYIYYDKVFYNFYYYNKQFLIFGNIFSIKNSKFSFDLIKKKIINKNYESLIGRYTILEINLKHIKIIPDASGRVDLFYLSKKNIISNNIEDLLPLIKKKINHPALSHSLSIYGFRSPKKNTIFDEIERIPPNGILYLSKKTKIQNARFYPKKINNNLKLKQFYDYFMSSIENKINKNGNILSLSSGWDSTSILAALIKICGKRKIKCFIGRMKFSKKSNIINSFEIARAKKIANYYGVPLKIVDLDYTNKSSGHNVLNYINVLKKFHLVSLPAINQMKLCESISKNYNGETFFTGEGSDGLQNFGFSQYATLYHDTSRDFREYSDKMMNYLFGPTFLEKIFKRTADQDLIFKFLKREKKIHVTKFKTKKIEILKDIFVSFFLRNNRFPNSSPNSLMFLTKKGIHNYQNYFIKNYFSENIKNFNQNDLYSYYLFYYKFFHWQSSTSLSRDYAADNYGIKISHPFLDNDLINFFSMVPENWGRGLDINNTKYALKKILRKKLDYPYYLQEGPHSYTYDVQPGFSIVNEFLNNSALKKLFLNKIKYSNIIEVLDKKFFNIKYAETLLKKYRNNQSFDNNQVRDLSSLIYHSNYFEDV